MAERAHVLPDYLTAQFNRLLETTGSPVALVTGGSSGEREHYALAQALDSVQERCGLAEQRAEDYGQIIGALVRRLGGRVMLAEAELALPSAGLVVMWHRRGGGVDIELPGQ